MGGRGASSGKYHLHKKEHKYGDEYQSELKVGNIKYVKMRDELKAVTAPIEDAFLRLFLMLENSTNPLYSYISGSRACRNNW